MIINSPAAAAGIIPNDILLSVDGRIRSFCFVDIPQCSLMFLFIPNIIRIRSIVIPLGIRSKFPNKELEMKSSGNDLTNCTHDRALEIMKEAPFDTAMELSRYFGRREDQEKKQGFDSQSLCSSMNWQTSAEDSHHMR